MVKKKDKGKKLKESIETVERKGMCLRCKKPLVKNHKTCVTCRRKERLMKKANKRGKPKNYYIQGGQ